MKFVFIIIFWAKYNSRFRCSLFLVVDDEEYESKKALLSIVFDACDNSNSSNEESLESTKIDKEIFNGEIKLPLGAGIVGHVALTGSSLNIESAYEVNI